MGLKVSTFLLILVSFSSRIRSQGQNDVYSEYDRLFSHFCTDEKSVLPVNATYSNVTQMHMTNNKCFCGYMKYRVPVESDLQSVRTSPLSSDDTALFTGAKTNIVQNTVGIPCKNGYVATPLRDYLCSNVDLLSFISLNELNLAYGGLEDEGSDVWGWTDEKNTVEIAMAGTASGVAFVDVTDPGNPFYIGKVPPARNGGYTLWRDIKTYKNFAYMVSEYGTMQYVNMTNLKENLVSIRSQGGGINLEQYSKDFTYELSNAHNLNINEESGFAYIVGSNLCRGGIYIVNLHIPGRPYYSGCFSGDGYTHDVQCVIYKGNDFQYAGREICFACNEDTVTIVDVTNKTKKTMLSKTSYIQAEYTHQGWLTEDHNHFIFGDELDEMSGRPTRTIVLDVKNLLKPIIAGYYKSHLQASDHNQYTVKNNVYQANYQAGLRILEIDDIGSAKFNEIGFFDVYGAGDSPGFNGAWSVYPFFPSGSLLVNGIEQGLFVLRKAVIPSDVVCGSEEECKRPIRNFFFRLFTRRKEVRYKMYKMVSGQCNSKCIVASSKETYILDGWKCGRCPRLEGSNFTLDY